MKSKVQDPSDESAGGKYVVIKVPREEVRKNIYSYFLTGTPVENVRKSLWIGLCAASLVLGVLIEAIFHWRIF